MRAVLLSGLRGTEIEGSSRFFLIKYGLEIVGAVLADDIVAGMAN